MISEHVKHAVNSWHGHPMVPSNCCSWCGECDSPEDTRGWPEDPDGDLICPDCAEGSWDAREGPVWMFGVYRVSSMLEDPEAPPPRRLAFRAPCLEDAVKSALRAAQRRSQEARMGRTGVAVFPGGFLEDVVWMWIPAGTE